MSKNKIDSIRKNISKRRKNHRIKQGQTIHPSYIYTEEKHGYMPTVESTSRINGTSSLKFLFKLVLSLLLFVFVKISTEPNQLLPEGFKEHTINAMTEDFPFAKAYVWYEQRFGTPLSLITDKHRTTPVGQGMTKEFILPVNGQVNSKNDNQQGIYIKPREISEVRAVRDGIVLFKGKDKGTNRNTVVIQHEDMSKSIYSNLSSINIFLYEFVNQNEVIGTINPKLENEDLYFSIEKDRQLIDPLRVIKID